jgi:glycosyl-4,4'-diaponeurosporenoate acyltransferase
MSGLPLVDIAPLAALAANIALWGASQALAGYVAHRLPLSALERDRGILRLRRFEQGGRWYERRLRIGRWKDRAPKAGAFFAGGMSKRSLPDRRDGGIERFAAETRRAEIAHWGSFVALPLCVIWNSLAGVVLMTAYGLAVNLPLIAIQRYNRARTDRILGSRRVSAAADAPPASNADRRSHRSERRTHRDAVRSPRRTPRSRSHRPPATRER